MERSGQSTLCTIFYAAVLTLSTVSSQSCTTETLDPRNVNSYDPSRLVPLFRQHPETFSHSGEQWIFPNLRFICSGILTQWIFAGVPGQATTPCRVELGIWRPDTFSTISNIYRQRSTTITERNLVPHVQEGKIFTYKLASPVPVEPGDIVGVELGRFCAPLEDLDNVLSHNISGIDSSYLSYRKDGSEPTFFLQSSFVIPEHDFVPLIEAVVEPLQEITGSVEIRTQSRATTAPEADQPDAPSASTIASAIFGAIVGVLITVIVCICVWCITRRVRIQVSCKKERETESAANTNKHQQNRQHHEEQQGESINVISMQQNEAYKHIQLTGTAEQTDYHTRAEWVPERAVQLNVAYGKRDQRCVEIEREETAEVPKQAVRTNPAYGKGQCHEVHVRIETEEIDDEYERMHAATTGHALLGQNARERENCSKRATPREYEVPVQWQGSHTFTQEDNEHQYDYVL